MSTTLVSVKYRRLAPWLVTAAAAIAIGAAPVAAADAALPMAGGESATATVGDLQAQGFNVDVNYLEGRPNVPLSECRVNGINDPSQPTAVPSTVTVYVDVLCPNAK
jgi:hypothetical protein